MFICTFFNGDVRKRFSYCSVEQVKKFCPIGTHVVLDGDVMWLTAMGLYVPVV